MKYNKHDIEKKALGLKKTMMTLGAALLVLHSSLLVSCIDTNVLPADKTIEEDFWKTKADVQLMVIGAYKKMVAADALNRMMLWGELRSDELTVNETPGNSMVTALLEVQAADIQTSNTFTDWGALYSVINYCNIVLSHAGQVMEIDPDYTSGDYLIDRSQMLALRALAHFYLVRAYRDVPLCTEAFMTSSQNLEVPQQAPLTVLSQCINDLLEARENALAPDGFTDWRRVGYINEEGINALLADIYLWRGSMTHSTEDYAQAVDCCERVIASKRKLYPKDANTLDASDYALIDGETAYGSIFAVGNSQEAVFELQLDGTENANTAVCQHYYLYARSAAHGYCYATPLFSGTGNDRVFRTEMDYRYWQYTYDVGNAQLSNFDVRKMVSRSMATVNPKASPSAYKKSEETREYSYFGQNWIVYRLSDVMLMEAEARVAMAQSDGDAQLAQAFALVREVNSRSLAQKSDSLRWANYSSVASMETLVLEERQRELCFEGKRWFDLMRYNYRHIVPSDPSKTLAQLSDEGVDFPRNDDTMLQLMARKYDATGNGAGVIAKMRTEPTLYWPVNVNEMKVNRNLRQNPVYVTDDLYQKNY